MAKKISENQLKGIIRSAIVESIDSSRRNEFLYQCESFLNEAEAFDRVVNGDEGFYSYISYMNMGGSEAELEEAVKNMNRALGNFKTALEELIDEFQYH